MRRILLWLLLILLIFGSGFFVWQHDLRVDYLERLAGLEATGEPVSYEYQNTPEVPAADNAAVLLEEARRWYRRFDEDGHEPACLYEDRDGWSDEDWAAAKEYVHACEEPYVKLLEAAVARPHCRHDLDWELGPELPVPMIPAAQSACRILELRALLAAREGGDPARAARSLVLMTEVADRLPRISMISHLVRQTVYRRVVQTLREIATLHGIGRVPAATSLPERLASVEDDTAMRDALRGERVLGIWVIERWILGDRRADPLFHTRSAWFHRPFVYMDGLRLLDFHDRTIALVGEPYHESRPRWEALSRETEELGFPYLATRLTMPAASRYAREVYLTHAQTRLARVALALVEHFDREGRWPASLAALGEIPSDPGTGAAFAFEHIDGGVRMAADPAPWDLPADELPDLEWRLDTP